MDIYTRIKEHHPIPQFRYSHFLMMKPHLPDARNQHTTLRFTVDSLRLFFILKCLFAFSILHIEQKLPHVFATD